jgi:hypothetical protein
MSDEPPEIFGYGHMPFSPEMVKAIFKAFNLPKAFFSCYDLNVSQTSQFRTGYTQAGVPIRGSFPFICVNANLLMLFRIHHEY